MIAVILFSMAERTKNDKYRKAAEYLHRNLQEQPRTEEGNFWHKEIYPNQVWLDGTYMALPFLAMYENTLGQGDISDIMQQMRIVRKRMKDPVTGLYYHGYDASRKAFWADPETGSLLQAEILWEEHRVISFSFTEFILETAPQETAD